MNARMKLRSVPRRTSPRRVARRGMASIELLMALGPLFLAAWAFVDLGARVCAIMLSLQSHLVLWALL